ncbi:MAG: hypothetical protein DRJ03_26600 [Chloroflexi bacterium]|nr:MAG: hypothetical protein DRJ03_26600 [Chloroflexota bacterium]
MSALGGRMVEGYGGMADSLRREMDAISREDLDIGYARRGNQRRSLAARSGGGLGSTEQFLARGDESSHMRDLARALLGNRMASDQLAGAHQSRDTASYGALSGGVTGIEGTRRLLSQSGTVQGNTMGDMLGGGMAALSNPLSAYNSGTGMFSNGEGGYRFGGGQYGDLIRSILDPGSGGGGGGTVDEGIMVG